MHEERREYAREDLALPMTLADGAGAMTRNLSAAGLYFVMSTSGTPLEPRVQVEFDLPGTQLRFTAEGEVVRVVPQAAGTGVALRLHGARLATRPPAR